MWSSARAPEVFSSPPPPWFVSRVERRPRRAMEACSVKAGINYLGQALHPNAIALPAPHGVSVARRSAGVPPQEIISKLEVSGGQAVMLSAIAWCPAAPELLAMAIDLERTVQLWRLQGELLSGSKIGEMALPGACRQLAWHPARRLLAVATPDSVSLLQLAQPGRSEPKLWTLLSASGVRCCAWGDEGNTLAAGCEGEVLLVSWPVPGVWDKHACVRMALPGQRVCALLPLEASEFILGLAPPIALGMAKGGAAGGAAGGGAAMLESLSSRVTLNTPQGEAAAPTALAVEAAAVSAAAAAAAAAAAVEAEAPTELLDLRGKISVGMHAVDPLRFLDLRLGAHLL